LAKGRTVWRMGLGVVLGVAVCKKKGLKEESSWHSAPGKKCGRGGTRESGREVILGDRTGGEFGGGVEGGVKGEDQGECF